MADDDMSEMQQAGWYPDPWGQGGQRWWDGQQWTSNVSGPAAAGAAAGGPGVAAPGAPGPGGAVQTSPPPPGPWASSGAGGPAWAAGPNPAGFPGPGGYAGAATKPAPPASPVIKVLALGGAVLAAIGSVLEWASVSTGFGDVTKNGLDADGVITLPAAVLFGGLALSALLTAWSKGRMIGALVVAALVALIAVADIADISSRFSDLEAQGIELDVTIGIGLWLVLVGAIVGVAGCVMALVSPKPAGAAR
jgi:hypothetical protein